ncbi:hypothetical protein F5Y03DRAFT_378957 [Xylaria venustula]|nr:hypothetical protein F5Y03DRAFT_378957 [Xylaria venustula]
MHFTLVLLFSLCPTTYTQGLGVGFISPIFQDTSEPGPYAGDYRWPLGSTQVVAFSTPWEEYRVEFWQQSLAGGSARRSSQFSYIQTAGQQIPQSFQWTVQTYELQLSNSPVFFFWLFNTTDLSKTQQASAYFNITIDEDTPSSKTFSTTLTSLPTSMLSGVLTASPTTPTNSSASTSSTPTPTFSDTEDASTGISTGAKAGIGLGASLGGLLVLVIAGLLYLKKNRLRGQRQQPPELQDPQALGYSIGSPETAVSMSLYTPKLVEAPSIHNQPPAELGE